MKYTETKKPVNETIPLVSVCLVVYNQKPYIAQCIDSILKQKTTFPFELIIGEDDSTDGTREICIKYAKEHPDRIRLFLRKEKDKIWIDGYKSGRHNFIQNLKSAKGKYIALLDGDDYWTDPLKLQKQVDLLENSDAIVGSYSDTYIKKADKDELEAWRNDLPDDMTLKDTIAIYSPFHSSSFFFRRDLLKKFPEWFSSVQSGDMFLFAYLALYGKLAKADTTATVYRKHDSGVTNSSNHNNNGFHIGRLFLWTKFKKEYQIKQSKIDDVIRFHTSSLLKNIRKSDMDLLLKQVGLMPLISSIGMLTIVKLAIKKMLVK